MRNKVIVKYSFIKLVLISTMQNQCVILQQSGFACSDSTESSGSSTPVIFENVLVFYFPFCQFPTLISLYIFLTETGDFSCNSSEMLIHFRFPNYT